VSQSAIYPCHWVSEDSPSTCSLLVIDTLCKSTFTPCTRGSCTFSCTVTNRRDLLHSIYLPRHRQGGRMNKCAQFSKWPSQLTIQCTRAKLPPHISYTYPLDMGRSWSCWSQTPPCHCPVAGQSMRSPYTRPQDDRGDTRGGRDGCRSNRGDKARKCLRTATGLTRRTSCIREDISLLRWLLRKHTSVTDQGDLQKPFSLILYPLPFSEMYSDCEQLYFTVYLPV